MRTAPNSCSTSGDSRSAAAVAEAVRYRLRRKGVARRLGPIATGTTKESRPAAGVDRAWIAGAKEASSIDTPAPAGGRRRQRCASARTSDSFRASAGPSRDARCSRRRSAGRDPKRQHGSEQHPRPTLAEHADVPALGGKLVEPHGDELYFADTFSGERILTFNSLFLRGLKTRAIPSQSSTPRMLM